MAQTIRTVMGFVDSVWPRRRWGVLLLASLAAVALISWLAAARAAPFVPAKMKLNDPFRSLAKVQRVSVDVMPPGAALEEVGITTEYIKSRIHSLLVAEGIQIVDEAPDTPVLIFITSVATDPQVEGVVAYTFNLQFAQDVHVVRLGRNLQVPTFNGSAVELRRRVDLEEAAKKRVDFMLKGFLRGVKVASTLP